MTARLISAAALCALCAGVLFAQQTAPRGGAQGVQSPPVFRSSVEAVQVDVYVADKDGRPVTDLTAGDFQVLENGEPQALTTFSSVSIPTERSEPLPFGAEPDVQTNNRPERHVFLFILSGAAPDWALRTRYLVRKFMDEHLGDNDIAAVITGRTFPGDRQDFTSNRRMLLAAVDRYSGEGIDRYELADLMEMMTRVPGGRKVAVWFGCPYIDGFSLIDYHGEKLFMDAEATHAAVAAATRGNIRIYVIDPVGLVGTEGGGCDPSGTRAFAEMTGGFALVNSNTFANAFDRLIAETSTYYVLGFNSTRAKTEGRYVNLEVRVNRPGLTVKSRNGYLMPMPYFSRKTYVEPAERTPMEVALANPLATAGVPMRVFAAPFRKSPKTAAVALVIDVNAAQLAFTQRNGAFVSDLDIRHLAMDVNHKIYPEYRQKTTISLDAAGYARVAASGIRVVSQFEVPVKGRYQVRVASASGERNGSVVYDLEVPDFADGPLAMSGIALATLSSSDTVTLRPGRNRNSTKKAAQCRTAVCGSTMVLESMLAPWLTKDNAAEDLLLRDALPVPPTAAREFAPDETLALFVEVYDNSGRAKGSAPNTLELAARLYNADGEVVRLATERRSAAAARRLSGGHGFTLRLPLDRPPAGSYVLRIEVSSTRSPEEVVSRSVPIRVKG